MPNFKKEDYDSWVVQKRPHNVEDKYYNDHDWTIESRNLDYDEAKKIARQKNDADYNKSKNGELFYLYRHYPEDEAG